ncbi:ATP-binding protein [Variovorax sp. AFSI2.2]|uniref:ATP-binding protein n=1 Tax=Variovorax sp. AFSI2.2 TaxID=3384160 RepID=UPI003EB78350
MKTKKVITTAALRANESAAFLNVDSADRAVVVGRRLGQSGANVGLLGKVCENAQGSSVLDAGVWLDLSFPHVIGIFGSRGSGKSFDLGVIAESVCGAGPIWGTKTQPTASVIFDVQDQFWTLGHTPAENLSEDVEQIQAIKAWGYSPTSASSVKLWAPAGYKTPLSQVAELQIAPSQLRGDDWLALVEIERFSPIGQALLTLVKAYPHDTPESLALRCLPAGPLQKFQASTVDSLRWRLESLVESQLIGGNGVALDELLRPGCISVILMRQLGEGLRSLVVGVLVRLLSDRMSYHHQEKRVARRLKKESLNAELPDRLWVFLDEAHVVVPAAGNTSATGPVVDYVKRGRDAGLSMVFATQQPSAVDPRLMSQVDITLTHYLGFDADLQAAVARMPTRSSVTYDIGATKGIDIQSVLRSLDPGECLLADAASGRVFATKIRPRVTAHGGNTPS